MLKRSFFILVTLFIAICLCSCTSEETSGEYWGSFTNAVVTSSDGMYRAEHDAIKHDDYNVSVIQVRVYNNHTDELIDSFIPARAMDFFGICWEENTHRIWTQSADVGIYCYELQDGHWVLNEDIERPGTIVSKWDEK